MVEENIEEFDDLLNYYFDKTGYEQANLQAFRDIEMKNPPTHFLREIEFIDTFIIGRYLGHLQTQLGIARRLNDEDDLQEYFDQTAQLDIGIILWNMCVIEERLIIIQTCNQIKTQIKQQRQNLARKYIARYVKDKDIAYEEFDSLEEPPQLHENIIEPQDADKLYDSVTDWMYVLIDEFENLIGLTATRDSRLDIVGLINTPETFFRSEVWDWMDEQPRNDFKESCRCIAFNAPTASVMLSLRAVEDSLQVWYEYDTDREIEDRTFGQVLSELEDNYNRSERPRVLSNLDYLKDRRNAVSHPEESASRREAERMIYRIEGTISEIYDHMN